MVWQHFSLFLKTFISIKLSWTHSLRLAVALFLVSSRLVWLWSAQHVYPVLKAMPQKRFSPFLNILPSWPRATAVASRAIKSHLTASLNRGCSLKLLSHRLQIYSSTCSPVNKLLDHLHSTVELIKSQDVLLSEETQTRALPEILSATAKSRVRNISSKIQNWTMNKGYAEIKSFLILISYTFIKDN